MLVLQLLVHPRDPKEIITPECQLGVKAVKLNPNSVCDSQQVRGGSLNCLEFGDSKFSSAEGCTGKKCPCPCQHGKETPETPDLGKITRQLSHQSINTVVAFSVVSPEIKQAIESVKYIAENMRSRNKAKEVSSSYFDSITLFRMSMLNKINKPLLFK